MCRSQAVSCGRAGNSVRGGYQCKLVLWELRDTRCERKTCSPQYSIIGSLVLVLSKPMIGLQSNVLRDIISVNRLPLRDANVVRW